MLRGIMYSRLRQEISFTVANILQATVFGIYHGDIIQGIYAFGIGLYLATSTKRKNPPCPNNCPHNNQWLGLSAAVAKARTIYPHMACHSCRWYTLTYRYGAV